MRCLVTGGAGFIGSHLSARLLAEGQEVVVLDNLSQGNKLEESVADSVEFIQGDIADSDTVLEAARGCDTIFHMASIVGVDIVAKKHTLTMEVEAMGMRNVARAAIEHGTRQIVYSSTSGVYGHLALDNIVTEQMDVAPESSYAIGKRFNEIYLGALNAETGISCVALRYFNVYGPRQDERMVLPRFINQALTNKPLTVFGGGQQTRDFTWIGDTVEATVKAAATIDGFEILNVANSDEKTIQEIAQIVVEVTDSESDIISIATPCSRNIFEVRRRVGSSEKLYNLTGVRPKTDVREGITSTIKTATRTLA
ncbi:NAD-dependent epimerase/dehydratase family protein [Dehalococcoides mccartyi]|nr:NAD-dependent epimerase/dehydratase family protein [Dehalococcoides mccartyi]